MKHKILNAAERLFWKRGFHATTMDDIVAAAGTTPRTVYRHFESKHALAAATIVARSDRFHQWYAERISELLENKENFFSAAIVAMAEWIEKYKQAGCFFLRAIADYGKLEPAIAAEAKRQKLRIRHLLEGSAKKHGVQLTPAELERLYFILEGLIASSRTLRLEAAMDVALSLCPNPPLVASDAAAAS